LRTAGDEPDTLGSGREAEFESSELHGRSRWHGNLDASRGLCVGREQKGHEVAIVTPRFTARFASGGNHAAALWPKQSDFERLVESGAAVTVNQDVTVWAPGSLDVNGGSLSMHTLDLKSVYPALCS